MNIQDNNKKVVLVKESYKDAKGHEYWEAICPYCGEVFVARKSAINSGNTKSCGCLKSRHGKEMGLANKKYNPVYFPLGCDYGICFYHNVDSYFIFDEKDLPLIKKHTWYGRTRKNGKVDAYTKIDGKTVYLTDLLMSTPVKQGQECDHINSEPRDNRSCNLRNGTAEMNRLNTERANGIYGEIIEGEGGTFIVRFPKYVSDKEFDTREEAETALSEFNEFTYRRSQEIAKGIETNRFNDTYHYIGVLDDIYRLPVKNVYKIWLTNIRVWEQNNQITDEQAGEMYLKLIQDYKNWLKEKTA